VVGRVAAALPKGRGLPPGVWAHRQRVIQVILWLHVVGIPVFAVIRGFPVSHAMIEGGFVLFPAFWAGAPMVPRLWRTVLATLGLLISSAVLVHLSGGSTVMHFHFFVMVPVVALYQEWFPFLLAIGFVAAHHTVFGSILPHDVFDNAAAYRTPWKWAIAHAVFVLGASAASVAAWKLNETAREQAELVLNSAAEGFFVVDEHGRCTFVNEAAAGLLGYEVADLLLGPIDVIHPHAATGTGDDDPCPICVPTKLSGSCHGDTVLRRRDGSTVAVEYTATAAEESGRWVGIVTCKDVTDKKLAEAALARESSYVRLLSEIATAANEATNTMQALQAAVATVGRATGWPLGHVYLVDGERLVPTSMWHVADGLDVYALQDETTRTVLARGVGLPGRVLETGAPVWMDDSAAAGPDLPRYQTVVDAGVCTAAAFPVLVGSEVAAVIELFSHDVRARDEDLVGVMHHVGAQLGRVVERQRAEEAMAHQAMHDRLTGLPNRALFGDRLAVALGRAAAKAGSVAVLFIDLDRFKLVNDSLGHSPGDQLLLAVAARLRAVIRPTDTVARLGGDEFTVVCEQISGEDEAIGIAERLADALSEPFVIDESELFVTASIGIALSSGADVDPDELLRDADAAMYRAKEQGRARWQLFNRDMRTAAVYRLETVNALHRALERGEFRVVYQPQIELSSSRVMGMEALVRWDHPQRGLIPPVEFIPLAEESGLIHDLGAWVLREACRQATAWHRLVPAAPGEPPLTMSVNLSPKQLQRSSLVAEVADVLASTGLDPSSLVLELTESVLMLDADSIISRLEALRALGLRLAIDDFGTGYSSLSYLQRFPIDVLKIDRSFIDNLGSDADHTAVARTIVKLGQSLRLETVAEGVERVEHLDHLRELNCDAAQGYLFARPLPPEQAETLLELAAAGLWSPGVPLPAAD
jgi:diguanylate cyclase (GGDEF)-like protein/PAS domain S-box-containing protein